MPIKRAHSVSTVAQAPVIPTKPGESLIVVNWMLGDLDVENLRSRFSFSFLDTKQLGCFKTAKPKINCENRKYTHIGYSTTIGKNSCETKLE